MSSVFDTTNKLLKNNEWISIENTNEENAIPSRLYKFFSFSNNDEEKRKRITDLANGEIWLSSRKGMNDPLDLIMMDQEVLTEEMRLYFVKSIKNKAYLCLTPNWDNILMWAHYAHSFSGYCIGFEFAQNDTCTIHKIQYCDSLVDLKEQYETFFEMLKNGGLKEYLSSTYGKEFLFEMEYPEKIKKLKELCKYLFYTKTKDWGYENEYRILTSYISDSGDYDSFKGVNYCMKKIGITPKEVIVGLNCKDDNLLLIQNMVETLNRSSVQPIGIFRLAFDGTKLTKVKI